MYVAVTIFQYVYLQFMHIYIYIYIFICTDIIVLCIVNVYNNVLCYWRESTAGEPRNLVFELCCILYFYYIMRTSISHWH